MRDVNGGMDRLGGIAQEDKYENDYPSGLSCRRRLVACQEVRRCPQCGDWWPSNLE